MLGEPARLAGEAGEVFGFRRVSVAGPFHTDYLKKIYNFLELPHSIGIV